MSQDAFSLFSVVGIEIEYMIVDAQTLAIMPIADHVLVDQNQVIVSDVENGVITWSNELAAHVIELKLTEPAYELATLPDEFQKNVDVINQKLKKDGAKLLPGGMHPSMNPDREFRRWDHEASEIYAAFDRIFDCRGHGWANLQSTHLNLPFRGDEEFGRLHAAIRVLLPVLPGLTASSPIYDGQIQPHRNARLKVYEHNAKKIPEMTAMVIPEPAYSMTAYHEKILTPLYQALQLYDPNDILQHEWANARGAIARFDRNAIEIRIMDTQEHPAADVAVVAAVCAVLKALAFETWSKLDVLQNADTSWLKSIYDQTVRHGEQAVIADQAYLRLFGLQDEGITVGGLWAKLLNTLGLLEEGQTWRAPLLQILQQGTLSTRILHSVERDGGQFDKTYHQLATCLAEGRCF